MATQNPPTPPKNRKAYRGMAMEGFIARWYSRNTQKNVEQVRSWAKLASASVGTGASILEVAPGPGYLSVELAKLDGSYRITGLDISKTFVGIAQEKARAAGVRVDFREGDAAYMPFPDDTFDFIVCTSAFKNFPEPVRVLDEMFRVLKAGGKVLIVDLDKNASDAGIDEYVDSMNQNWINSLFVKLTFKHGLLKWAYSKSQIKDLATKSRFGGCEILDEGIGFEAWLEKRGHCHPSMITGSEPTFYVAGDR
jgi:ubiquinone/menaquinone biosynthesis C-methylase UbiE